MNNSSTNPNSNATPSPKFDEKKILEKFETAEALAKELLIFKDDLYEANELTIGSTKYGNKENLVAVHDLLMAEHKYVQLINASSVFKQSQDSNGTITFEIHDAIRVFLSKIEFEFKSFEVMLNSVDPVNLPEYQQITIEAYKKDLTSWQTLLQQTNELNKEFRSNFSKLLPLSQEHPINTKQSLSLSKLLIKHFFKFELFNVLELIGLSVAMCFVLTCILYWLFSLYIPFFAQWPFANSKEFLEVDYLSASATISSAIIASLGVFFALHQTYLSSKSEATDKLANNVKSLTSDTTIKYRMLIEDITNIGLTEELCRSSLKNILIANNRLESDLFALMTLIYQQITNLASEKTDPLYLALILLKRSVTLYNKVSNKFYLEEVKPCLEGALHAINSITNLPPFDKDTLNQEVYSIKKYLIHYLDTNGTYKITLTNITDLIVAVQIFNSSLNNYLDQTRNNVDNETKFLFTNMALNGQISNFAKLLKDLKTIEQFFNQISNEVDTKRGSISFILDKNSSSQEILESALEVQKKAIEILAKL